MFNRFSKGIFKGSVCILLSLGEVLSCGGTIAQGMEGKHSDDLPKTSNEEFNKFIEEFHYDAQQVLNKLLAAQYKVTVSDGIKIRLRNEEIYIKYLRNPNLDSNSELTQDEKLKVKRAKEET